MQFDKDMNGKFSELFIHLREVILSFDKLSEVKNAKQTSYRDGYGRVICILRTDSEKTTLVLAQGAKLQSRYPLLKGAGKIVRHLYFDKTDQIDDDLIKEIIAESLIVSMESMELKRLRQRVGSIK